MVYGHMCICDVELLYLRRLAAYLRRHPGFLWRIKTYTDLGACLKEMPEVLLVSGQALTEYGSGEGDECLLEIVGCQIILLKDGQILEELKREKDQDAFYHRIVDKMQEL